MGCKVFQMGVFFDGTGNSRKDKSTYSNVAKLYEAYKILKDELSYRGKKTTTAKLYVTGVGTATMKHSGHGLHYKGRYMEEKDSSNTKHYAGYKNEGAAELAAGGGGAKRIYDAIDKVCKELDAHLPKSTDNPYGYVHRIIDVFGFSRGAAEARDFVNTFYLEKVNSPDGDYNDVRFNFIGIFDTVGSFGAAGTAIDMKPKKEYADSVSEGDGFWKQDDHQHDSKYESYNFNLAPASAHMIAHMTAHDEVRHNFPLTNAQGCGHTEWSLIGVHSDVGGGYDPKDEEVHVLGTEYHSSADAVASAEAEAKRRNALRGDFTAFGRWEARSPECRSGVDPYQGVVPLCRPVIARTVTDALAKVSLNLMHREALIAQVPLGKVEAVPAPLQGYYAYAHSARTIAYTYAGYNQEGHAVKDILAHQSATQKLYTDDLRQPKDMAERYVGSNAPNIVQGREGETIVRRAIYPNEPTSAITPKAKA